MKSEHYKSIGLGTIYVLILILLLIVVLASGFLVLLLFGRNPPFAWFRPVVYGMMVFLNVVVIATLAIANRVTAVRTIFGGHASIFLWSGWLIPLISVIIAIAGGLAWNSGYVLPEASSGSSGWDWD